MSGWLAHKAAVEAERTRGYCGTGACAVRRYVTQHETHTMSDWVVLDTVQNALVLNAKGELLRFGNSALANDWIRRNSK